MEYNDEVSGIIEVDSEGNAHCGKILFARSMAFYQGCRCKISRYWDNEAPYGREYPYFISAPKEIDYSLSGIVEEAEDGKLHVGKYVLPYHNPPIVSKGAAIMIKQIHPIVKKGTEYYGTITEFTQYGVENKDVIPSGVCFLVDTNVLMDCPTLFDHINESNPVIIVNHVITELDGLKKSPDDKTHQAAQKANTQILEASKQGKVIFASTRPPFEPFVSPYTMDQKILSAAFLNQFQDATVVLLSSDKNMLLLAESTGVKGITLEDFLYGNYTIETKDPIQRIQPRTEADCSDLGQDIALEIYPSSPLNKFSRHKENLEKDLERKYNEYSQLFIHLGHNIFPEVWEVDEDKLLPVFVEFRKKIDAAMDALSLSFLLFYDSIIHTLLFTNWSWKTDKVELEKHGVSYRNHTADEIYAILSKLNFDAVSLLIDDLGCPLGIKETLRSSLSNKQKDTFVKTVNELSCDLSILHFYTDYISLMLSVMIGMFGDPQAYYDFIFHSDYGKLADSFKATVPLSFKKDPEESADEESFDDVASNCFAAIDSSIIEILRRTYSYIDEIKGSYFPFEKEYLDRLLFHPYLQPYWEKVAGPEIEATPIDEVPTVKEPEEVDVRTDELHWPTDEELLSYEDNFNTSEYFPYTIFGPAGHVKASEIKELFEVLSSEFVLEDDLETRLIFLARYSGKIIPGLTLKSLKWAMVKDRDAGLGYLILRTANGDYASAKRFFYYDTNGKREMPVPKVIGPYAHNWDILSPIGSSKKPLKMKIDEFLENYEKQV